MMPKKTVRIKNMAIAVWSGKFPSYTITKGYKDNNSEWKNERISLCETELFRLLKLIQQLNKGDEVK